MLGAATLVALGTSWLTPGDAWAANRYLSAAGSDSGSCASPGAACRSFGYAYRQAAPGDVVEVAAGSYPAQDIPKVAGRGGPAVAFRAAGGAVSLADLQIHGDHVSIQGVSSSGVDVDHGSGVRDVTVIGVRAQQVWLENAHDVRFLGGSYGDNRDHPTMQISGAPASTNILIDGVDFHDAVASNSSVHMECIWAGGVQGFTVRNSIFRNCAHFDIFFTRLNGPDPRDVLLENNVFEMTKVAGGQNAYYSINVANWLSRVDNFTFRNNTFGADVVIQPSALSGVKMVGNVGPIASCKGGVQYSHNVFTKAKCSATDKQVAGAMSQFVDPAAHDWHLRPGAAAINAGDPNDHPSSDREGLLRSGPPDAGAHEYGGLRPNPGGSGQPGLRKRRSRLLAVGLARHRICKRPRRRCKKAIVLRVRLARRAKVTVKVQRRRRAGWSTVRRLGRTAGPGRIAFKIKAKGLRRGSYRLVVTARRGNRAAVRRLGLVVR